MCLERGNVSKKVKMIPPSSQLEIKLLTDHKGGSKAEAAQVLSKGQKPRCATSDPEKE